MTKKELEKRLIDAEDRIRQLEARPLYVQPTYVAPVDPFQPAWLQPNWPLYPTITC